MVATFSETLHQLVSKCVITEEKMPGEYPFVEPIMYLSIFLLARLQKIANYNSVKPLSQSHTVLAALCCSCDYYNKCLLPFNLAHLNKKSSSTYAAKEILKANERRILITNINKWINPLSLSLGAHLNASTHTPHL